MLCVCSTYPRKEGGDKGAETRRKDAAAAPSFHFSFIAAEAYEVSEVREEVLFFISKL